MDMRTLSAIHAETRPAFRKGDTAVRHNNRSGGTGPVMIISVGPKWITARPDMEGATREDDQRFHRDTLTDEGGFSWTLWTVDGYRCATDPVEP